MNQTNGKEKEDLVKLWTEMGASTGSLLGRMIGVGAVLGLETISAINKPLSQGLQTLQENRPKGKEPHN